MSLKTVLCLCACLAALSIVQGKLECKDRLRGCSAYPKDFCYRTSYAIFMEENCGNYCGYCNCANWKYGCCKDTNMRADGPNKLGCSRKLCYDVRLAACPEIKQNGTCYKEVNKEDCPWTCGYCRKMPAPIKRCANGVGYGCCWDGTPALGPNKKGCAPCMDHFKIPCKQFAISPCSNTGAYYIRSFLLKYCAETCGRCESCRDRDRRCGEFLIKGHCYNQVWRPYLASSCAKTCGFCKDKTGNPLP